MKLIKILSFGIALFTLGALTAQNFGDALRYSLLDPTGTARFLGAGSALGPLGADFSVMSTNPAGLAWMRKSEFMISPGLHIATADAKLSKGEGNLLYNDATAKFNLPNIGIVTSSRGGSGMETFNFGIGINRLADFSEEFSYQGTSEGSITDRFQELANDFGSSDFEAGLAIDAEALFLDNEFYFSDYAFATGIPIHRSQSIVRDGSLSEISFGFAGNVQNKVLWGLTLGVPILNFDEEKIYEESDPDNLVEVFDELRYTETLSANGAGINLKLGFIYRVDQALRLSLAIHTPTYFQIDETFSTELGYDYTLDVDGAQSGFAGVDGSFNYGLRTPWRFMFGAGGVISNKGFLTAELEYVNYSNNRFLFEGFPADEAILNEEVGDNLEGAIKLRTGAEIAFGDFRARGGVGVQQAPIVGDNTFYTNFSLGLGYRGRKHFVDLGYRRLGLKESYVPYLTADAPQQLIDIDVVRENIVLTLGTRW
jgi:hypothetical protein